MDIQLTHTLHGVGGLLPCETSRYPNGNSNEQNVSVEQHCPTCPDTKGQEHPATLPKGPSLEPACSWHAKSKSWVMLSPS